jgi:hypothetical protein
MYNLTIDMTQFTAVRMSFYCIGIIYILYLLFLIIRAFGELHNMPYFGIYKIFFLINFLILF